LTSDDGNIPIVHAEPVVPGASDRLAHLRSNRGLIVRRALLAGAIRGFFPIPLADDLLCSRIGAGLFRKLAELRQVDLPPDSALLLAASGAPRPAASLSLTAVAAVVARFAGRKALAVLAAGRSADDMARTFLRATLFDHYCAKLHVGGQVTTATAERLCACLDVGLTDLSASPIVEAFRAGGRMLGRSLLQAPGWLVQQFAKLGERFIKSGGNPDVLNAFPELGSGETTWLDRAAQSVDQALARAGAGFIEESIERFVDRWQVSQEPIGTGAHNDD
jgi:hypothetical protein